MPFTQLIAPIFAINPINRRALSIAYAARRSHPSPAIFPTETSASGQKDPSFGAHLPWRLLCNVAREILAEIWRRAKSKSKGPGSRVFKPASFLRPPYKLDFWTNFIQIPSGWCLSSELVNNDKPGGFTLGAPGAEDGWCEALYEAKAAQLILYGRALGLSHGEAEDVLQETFVALLQLSTPPELPEHYCVRSFRNRALNYRRGLWRRLSREIESRCWFEPSSEDCPLEREAMRCLARLPVAQREVIVLKIWHEHTFEEIGELLEISPNTAAGRYRYGLQKLKTSLKGATYERNEQLGSAIAYVGAAPPLTEA